MATRLRNAAASVLYGRQPTESDFRERVWWGAEGNAIIRRTLASGSPCFITRLSTIELATTRYYLKWRRNKRIRPAYLAHQKRLMQNLAGFFPPEDVQLDRFAVELLEWCSAADVMALSFHRDEDVIVNRYCPDASLVQIDALNCMCYEKPWSAELEGKTVLVVHPFARTIESQYRERRTLLYEDPSVLPEFDLKTLIPVQSSAGCETGHASWFEALDYMLEEVSTQDFDVAVVGAGAYGMPIGAFIKSMGRQVVHLGGATQLLFGIKGRRWERDDWDDLIVRHYNDAWVRPTADETPAGADGVEGGCFW